MPQGHETLERARVLPAELAEVVGQFSGDLVQELTVKRRSEMRRYLLQKCETFKDECRARASYGTHRAVVPLPDLHFSPDDARIWREDAIKLLRDSVFKEVGLRSATAYSAASTRASTADEWSAGDEWYQQQQYWRGVHEVMQDQHPFDGKGKGKGKGGCLPGSMYPPVPPRDELPPSGPRSWCGPQSYSVGAGCCQWHADAGFADPTGRTSPPPGGPPGPRLGPPEREPLRGPPHPGVVIALSWRF
eukprot:TRINITY_DN44_c1_g1_i1.p2 TRINITY_DN44_c1_g1~~TRINITY_DN44_c1_g1_i1.p2  ORF type:complete len:275 (+),score=72.96 TRINITY_DN44_c1_g1_i1:86-826(+)